MKWFWIPLLIMATSAGYIHWQGMGTMVLSVFFGATDGAQTFMEANPANPHPAAKIPARFTED